MSYRRVLIGTIVFFLGLLSTMSGLAGPLDRGSVGPRSNAAAENMLRVPGVVGSYEQEALGILQQAGLAVNIKRITKDEPKFEKKEGVVVSQEPSAGGVAMVGSSVTITVYKTGQGDQEGGGYYGGDDQWGDESYPEDDQQGYGEPAYSDRPGEWQAPPPDEDSGGYMEELDVGGRPTAPPHAHDDVDLGDSVRLP